MHMRYDYLHNCKTHKQTSTDHCVRQTDKVNRTENPLRGVLRIETEDFSASSIWYLPSYLIGTYGDNNVEKSMLSAANDFLVDELAVGMTFELIIVVALIILFMVSLCSLLQKIRKAYDHDNARRRTTEQQVFTVDVPPTYESQTEINHGIYPGNIAPPAYTEHYDPPPKYDDVIKTSLPTIHQPTTQSQQPNQLTSVTTQ